MKIDSRISFKTKHVLFVKTELIIVQLQWAIITGIKLKLIFEKKKVNAFVAGED